MLLSTYYPERCLNTRIPWNFMAVLTGLPNSALSEHHHLERFLTWTQTDFTERRFGWGGCRHILVMMLKFLLAGQDPLEHGNAGRLLSSPHTTLCPHLRTLQQDTVDRSLVKFMQTSCCLIRCFPECFHAWKTPLGSKPHKSIPHHHIVNKEPFYIFTHLRLDL
jgi:hypothetical protein